MFKKSLIITSLITVNLLAVYRVEPEKDTYKGTSEVTIKGTQYCPNYSKSTSTNSSRTMVYNKEIKGVSENGFEKIYYPLTETNEIKEKITYKACLKKNGDLKLIIVKDVKSVKKYSPNKKKLQEELENRVINKLEKEYHQQQEKMMLEKAPIVEEIIMVEPNEIEESESDKLEKEYQLEEKLEFKRLKDLENGDLEF